VAVLLDTGMRLLERRNARDHIFEVQAARPPDFPLNTVTKAWTLK
jgi:hypothetical protein